MSDLAKAKKVIQKNAWDYFPAQEIWIRPDLHFWAFDKVENSPENMYVFTCGIYSENKVIYKTEEKVCENIEEIIEQKSGEGFECFAAEI